MAGSDPTAGTVKRRSLALEVFLAMVAVALLSVGVAGLIARNNAEAAFIEYLNQMPMGRGMAENAAVNGLADEGSGGGGVTSPGGPADAGQHMGAGRQRMLSGAEQTFVASLERSLLTGAVAAFLIAAMAGLALAYYLMRPLERLTVAARVLASGDLSHRVEVTGSREVERLGGAFNEMAQSLAHAEELRRRLVADVAHELRNPIAALRAQAEGMAEGVLEADAAQLASIAEDTRYLSTLVADLQELSLADAGQLRYDLAPLDLSELACREVALLEQAAAGASVTLSCRAGGPFVVMADEARLRQVLRNLLYNALRHAQGGEVEVVLEAMDASGGRGAGAQQAPGTSGARRVRLEVRDTGEGIPEKDLPHVFERFYRADSARARATGGSGIGLAITRRIVEDLRGSVFAANRDGGGAIVGFELPLES